MIGRKAEAKELNDLYRSDKAHLVAVYGRRRVGKTFLVQECFDGRFTFRHAGLSPIERKKSKASPMKAQLKHFYNSLLLYGMEPSSCPDSWLDAFFMLEKLLAEKDDGHRQVVFIDELPWMDTPRSGFVTAFEGFWNTWGCARHNLMVIVCGSATSWIMDKLINSHGGLYGRVTREIHLSPFSLSECEEYFRAEGIKLSRYDIVQAYMITGGIPYYLSYFKKGLSLPQNVDRLFFTRNASLRDEYDRLFSSIFINPEEMKKIVTALNGKKTGYTKDELAAFLGGSAGGTLTDHLKALESSNFILSYTPFGPELRKTKRYRLVDPFCLFYLRFVDGKPSLDESFWQVNALSQSVVTWRGLAFENVCFNHITQIKEALGIRGVTTEESSWTTKIEDEGAQVDLVINRRDNVVDMCEIKFYGNAFVVDKKYHMTLVDRQSLLSQNVPRKSIIHSVLITTYGLKYNEYSSVFDNVVTLDDLFC